MKNLNLTNLVSMAACLLAVALFACGGEPATDDGQPADTVQADEGQTGDDVLVDAGRDDTPVDTGIEDVAVDTAVEDTAVDTGIDSEVLDNTVTFEACPTGAGENTHLPWVTEFDIGGVMTANGWGIIRPQAIAGGMWDLASSAGVFGTNTGRFAVFMGEEGDVSRTGLVSDCVDTSVCAGASTVTLQWRMQYLHADPTRSVTLKLVAIQGTDLDAGVNIWTATVTEDIPYDLYSVELPTAMANVNGIRFALVLEFPDESALVTETWSIDHFVMSCGKANSLVKTLIYECPEGETACTIANATQIGDAIPAETPVTMTMDYCARDLVVLCGYDQDATAMTWQTWGFPGILRDTLPSVQHGSLTPSTVIGAVNGCETLPMAVATVCGTPATETSGYFYCAAELSPACDFGIVATWTAGLVIRDELDGTGEMVLHSPLESLTPITVTATYPPD